MTKVNPVIIGAIILVIAFTTIPTPKQAIGDTIQFRTNDFSYASYIGYTDTCGNDLVSYVREQTTGLLTGDCVDVDTDSWTGQPLTTVLTNLPGGYMDGGANPSLKYNEVADRLIVCDDDGANRYILRRYELGGDIDTSPISTNPVMEMVCACTPDCSCEIGTCIGETCEDGCGGFCDGLLDCASCPTMQELVSCKPVSRDELGMAISSWVENG